MACCSRLQRSGWAAPRSTLPPTAAAAHRRPLAAAWRPQHRPPVAAQAARQQPEGSSRTGTGDGGSAAASEVAVAAAAQRLQAHLQQVAAGSPSADPQLLDSLSTALRQAEADPAAVEAAHKRLAAYLQQQGGISRAQAAQLAGKVSAKLGAAADQLVPAPLQWFVGRGMRPLKAAQLVVQICKSTTGHASIIRHWPTWQPVFEANWQLADSCLAAYQQQCKAANEWPLKSSELMAVLLSSMPSRYMLLLVRDLPGKVVLLQQQLNLSAAGVGGMVAAGLQLSGSMETVAATLQWMVSFAGSQEAAAGMLRAAPTLLSYSTATLDSKAEALQAAWAGVLQPEQLRQLVVRLGTVLLNCQPDSFSLTAAVLRSWFTQPSELYTLLQSAPQLLAAPAATLQANERWFTGPPLSLSRQQFLERVQAAPQAFFQNFEEALMQRKLAFLTQVGGVPLERALSNKHLNYLKHSIVALAGRYFLLTAHGVPVRRHKDGGITLSYASMGLRHLLRHMRRHDSQRRLPGADDAALAYIQRWLAAWPETESGQRWHNVQLQVD